jgi:5,10-methylenetetrahydromethanopterin reductase
MKLGIGLDGSDGMTWDEQRQLAREAAALGYHSMWTPGFGGRDPFQRCGQWNAATRGTSGGIHVGTSVVSVPLWHPMTLAVAAAAVSDATGGRLILGIGPSAITSAAYRKKLGVNYARPLALMREYVAALRGLLDGQSVYLQGDVVKLDGAALGFTPPPVPIQIGGMADNLLRLAGEIADGATLNWCSPERIRWSRDRVNEGALAAGRNPSTVTLSSHIRVSVDEDRDLARRALATSVSHYALAEPGESKTTIYRGQFARMGYDELLLELEERRDAGESMESICERFPEEMLSTVGCYGTPEEIAAKVAPFTEGVDIPIIRVVTTKPGIDNVRSIITACRPDVLAAATRPI